MSNKIMRAADVKGDTPFDKIYRAWLGHQVEQLPEELARMLNRWEMVDKLIRVGSVHQTVNDQGETVAKNIRYNFASIVAYLKQNYSISSRQAYDDIANAKRFFLSAEGRPDKEYARGVAIEHGEQMMWAAFEAGDFDAASKFFKEVNAIKGLHEASADLPDYSDFEPPKFVITTDPTELGFEKIDNLDEVVKRIANEKRNDFMASEAEDVEVEPDE